MKAEVTVGKCQLCRKGIYDEGVQLKIWWFIKVFICESCISKLFRQFSKKRLNKD